MADNIPYKPQFPYLGNQVIISSGRVHLHAKDDAVFILGKQAVGISSTKTVNIDALEAVKISTPKIQLGLEANQQVILGTDFISYLKRYLDEVSSVANDLQQASASKLSVAMASIHQAGKRLSLASSNFKNTLDQSLSKTTFTK